MNISKPNLEEAINNFCLNGEQVQFLMSATQEDIVEEFIHNNEKITEFLEQVTNLRDQLFKANFYGIALLDQYAQRDGFYENLSHQK